MISVLRFVVRLIGLVFALFGVVLIVALIMLTAIGRAGEVLGQVWFDLHHSSENLTQAIIQRYVHPAIWDPGIVTLLGWPSWMALALTGLVALMIGWFLFVVSRRRRA